MLQWDETAFYCSCRAIMDHKSSTHISCRPRKGTLGFVSQLSSQDTMQKQVRHCANTYFGKGTLFLAKDQSPWYGLCKKSALPGVDETLQVEGYCHQPRSGFLPSVLEYRGGPTRDPALGAKLCVHQAVCTCRQILWATSLRGSPSLRHIHQSIS